MCIEELSESLINNKRNGIYRSVDYVKNLYYRYKSNVKLPRITTDEVQPFKIYQNSSDEKELIEFINRNDIK